MRLGWLGIAGMTAMGCMMDAASETELGSEQSAIINGTLDDADPAVVMLRSESGLYCTGALVSRTIVVTAAHCLDASGPMGVGFGIDGWSTPVTVSRQIPHPLWDGKYDSGHDVAVLVLASEVSNVTPLPLSGDASAARQGAVLRIVGYGDNTAPTNTGFGVKRQATLSASSTTSDLLIAVSDASGTQSCHGDSGGPALSTDAQGVERVVGVASYGYPNCQGGAFFTRLAAHADFLADYVEIEVPPAPPPPPPAAPDTVMPTVRLVTPSNGRVLLAGRRSIVFEALDDVGIANVALNWSHNGKVIQCAAPSAGWSCSVSGHRYTFSADIGSGLREFTVEASDQAGNIARSPRYALRFL
jgi:hypothetical protein